MTTDLKISFDLSEVLADYSIKKSDADVLNSLIVQSLSDAVIFHWREEASKNLGSSRAGYKNGIQLIEIDDKSAVIALIGVFNNMLENGAVPFDIKQGMANSTKRKLKKSGDGWHITIPFRWGTPNASVDNEAFSGIMPEEVYEIAKDLVETTTNPKKKIVYGERLDEKDLSKQLQKPKTRSAYGSFGAYTHKSSIYEGITRQEKTYEKATQSTYFSFRRVSDLSDPNSWIHPGFTAKNLAEKAVDNINVDLLVNNQVTRFLQSLGI